MNNAATVHWVLPEYAHGVAEFRACELCSHSARHELGLTCTHPHVAGSGHVKPASAARAKYGGCGPDALYLHMQGWPT